MTISVRWKAFLPRVVFAGLAAFFFHRWGGIEPQQVYNASGVIAGLCATLLGFMVAATAIVTALFDRTLISNMRKTGHYKVLMNDTFATCGVLLLTLVVSVATLAVDKGATQYAATAVLFMFTLSVLYVYESGRRFAVVVMAL